jgi:hypothetical protein
MGGLGFSYKESNMLYSDIPGYERLAGEKHDPLSILIDSATLLRACIHQQIEGSKNGTVDLPAFIAAIKSLVNVLESIEKMSLKTNVALDRESARLLAVNVGRILAEELKQVPVEVFDRVAARIGRLLG